MPRRLLLIALVAFAPAGCSSLHREHWDAVLCDFHPCKKVAPQVEQLCQSVPANARDHVYLFVVNGLDPLYMGNLVGLCDRVKSLGFRNTHCGQMSAMFSYRKQIRDVRTKDPDARIVLLGYSCGANCVRCLANQLRDDGVKIDLLVYLGGDTIGNTPSSRPENVAKVLNINGHGLVLLGYDAFFCGWDIDGASNHRLDSRHILLPSRAEATELLVQHLVAVAEQPTGEQRVRLMRPETYRP